MTNAESYANRLLDFLEESPTPFHASGAIAKRLEAAGFRRLREDEPWNLAAGDACYLVRHDTTVAAFRIGSSSPSEAGFRIAGGHIDSPGFKIKEQAEKVAHGVVTYGVEVYGGPIIATWLDRSLSVAGRVMVRRGTEWHSRLLATEAMATIPNLAIHLNRKLNDGFKYNQQDHLPAILAVDYDGSGRDALKTLIAQRLEANVADIGASDVFLVDGTRGDLLAQGELICAPRIDNLAASWQILTALTDSPGTAATQIGMFYDHEEIGSRSPAGADSPFLSELLDRIVHALGGGYEDRLVSRHRSFLLSNDAAHAVHPNFTDKHDPAYTPRLNGGPVLKMSATYRYTTTARSGHYVERLAAAAGVTLQKITNRSDIRSGSTIGPPAAAAAQVMGADIGVPLLAMHSIRETTGVRDNAGMVSLLGAFFAAEEPLP
jgi:aspartyl aminopeptidase